MFRVGQKVVCVDASLPSIARAVRWLFRMGWPLVEGNTYTVQRLFSVFDEAVLELLEVKNTPLLDRAFRRTRFRPLVERKTDISIFTRLLAPSREKEAV